MGTCDLPEIVLNTFQVSPHLILTTVWGTYYYYLLFIGEWIEAWGYSETHSRPYSQKDCVLNIDSLCVDVCIGNIGNICGFVLRSMYRHDHCNIAYNSEKMKNLRVKY